MKQYVLLDLDGTLTDPGVGITNSVMYALAKFNIKETDRTKLYPFIGPPLMESFQRYYNMTPRESRQALDYYREYFSTKGLFENEVYDGCAQFLATLNAKGYSLILASSKPEIYVKQILDHFDLSKYFLFIGGSDFEETRVCKKDVIHYCLQSAKISAKDSIMIGDRMHDVEGAKANGMKCIGVLYGYGSQKELEDAGANALAADFDQLLRAIETI